MMESAIFLVAYGDSRRWLVVASGDGLGLKYPIRRLRLARELNSALVSRLENFLLSGQGLEKICKSFLQTGSVNIKEGQVSRIDLQ